MPARYGLGLFKIIRGNKGEKIVKNGKAGVLNHENPMRAAHGRKINQRLCSRQLPLKQEKSQVRKDANHELHR